MGGWVGGLRFAIVVELAEGCRYCEYAVFLHEDAVEDLNRRETVAARPDASIGFRRRQHLQLAITRYAVHLCG